MKSTDDLVSSVRSDSRNSDAPDSATSTIGIATADIVRYLNYGQERLQNTIQRANPVYFQKQVTGTVTTGVEEYTPNVRILAGERIVNVEYSPTGQSSDYRDLPERGISYRRTSTATHPSFYIRQRGSVLLDPIVTQSVGLYRITYEEQLDTLALRNGTINGTPSGATIVLSSPTTAQEAFFTSGTFICVSKSDGTVVLRNGVINSYNSSTDTITLAANVSTYLVSGYALADLASAYVTIGKWTTTHSKLPDNCERYLELYAGYKCFSRDSSDDRVEARNELEGVEQEILRLFQDAQRDEVNIQVCNSDLVVDASVI